ncbi:MAG: hypothetical protein WC405_01760 [Syntrophales bacterium]
MAAASKPIRPLMGRRFKRFPRAAILLVASLILGGCLSLRIDKVTDGAEVKPLPQEFAVGKTTLADILASYGAPADIVDMKGHFALHYQRSFYRGGQLSLSIPLSDVLRTSPKLDAAGNLLRYDAAVFILTPDGVLSEMTYENGIARPLWNTYWK